MAGPLIARPYLRDGASFNFEQSSFALGVATTPDPRLLQDGQYQRSINAYPGRDGRAHRRRGFVQVLDAGPMKTRAMRWYVPEQGGPTMLIVWYDDKVGYVDVDGALQDLGETLDTTKGIAHEAWNDSIWYSDGVHGLKRIEYPYADRSAFASLDVNKQDAGTWSDSITHYDSITFTTKSARASGNGIQVVVLPGEAIDRYGAAVDTTVVVEGTVITIQLGTSRLTGDGAWGGTAQHTLADKQSPTLVKAAVEANADAAALINVTIPALVDNIIRTTQDIQFIVPGTVTLAGGATKDELVVTTANADRNFTKLCARQASERIFGIDADDETNIRWCRTFDGTTFDGLDVWSPGGVFRQMADTGDTFLAFTDETMYRIDGSDPLTWIARKVQSNGLSCVAADTVEVIEGIAVYQSPRGIAYFDGTKPKLLSDLVFDSMRPDISLVPVTDMHSFATQTGEFYMLFYGVDGADGASKVVVYDFRLQAWGGPFELDESLVVTCCAPSVLRDAKAAVPTLATVDGLIVVEDPDIYTDLGAVYQSDIACKTIDGARRSLDKIFSDMRCVVRCEADTEITFGMLFEDETTPREGAYSTITLSAGEHAIRKRLMDVRATTGTPFMQTSAESDVELVTLSVDLFFPQPR